MGLPLEGRTALVTGASGGIGRAVALELARRGADVVLTYRRGRDAALEVAGLIRGMGRRAWAVQADLAREGGPEGLARSALEAAGRIDILVNNAGTGYAQPFHAARLDLVERELRTDLLAPMILARLLLPGMLERGWGRIINVSSIAGLTGAVFLAGYSAAKAGLIGFTRSLAAELAGTGVTVNAVAPGFVATRLGLSYFAWLERALGVEGALEEYLRRIPPGRLATPEEVAAVVGFLAGPGASGVNGEVIIVDAGATLSPGAPARRPG